ncbi:hypothetical protein [Nocardia jejuensis]|uniref:hypothetical protein n=1 Tax=Nocardia jejuensis TaxID=328049 RepID=UPI000B1759C5|nr:hypothetical protein [Nocardia jejuensis]
MPDPHILERPDQPASGPQLFETSPDEDDWNAQLGGQTRLMISADRAMATVRDAWARIAE